MSKALTYKTAVVDWKRPPAVLIEDTNGDLILTVPLAFCIEAGSKKVSTVEYLLLALAAAIENDPGSFDLQREGHPCNSHDTITAATYCLIYPRAEDINFRPGPQAKSRFKTLPVDDTDSTVSKSSRSSTLQSAFRLECRERDNGRSMLTRSRDGVEACHIIPFSLGQSFLDELTDFRRTGLRISLYDLVNGLTLDASSHKAFDKYEFGIWVEDGRYFVHSFLRSHIRFHGHEIEFAPVIPDYEKPSPILLQWHYKQCVIARLRGFSVPLYTET